MAGSDLRSPDSHADVAVLPEGGPGWLEELADALQARGFHVRRAPVQTLEFEAFVTGAALVVIAPGADDDLSDAWLRMCERAPKKMAVSGVALSAGDADTVARWLAAGFDEVWLPGTSAASAAACLHGRLRSREVHHNLATTDPLTHLVTQNVFFSRLDPTVRLSSRAGMPMAVAVIDMDGFRDLERRRGRVLVRQLLRDTSEHLQRALRRSDTVARLGDDRFGLILHHITAFEARRLLFQMWRSLSASAEALEMAGPQDRRVTFTAGVAVFPGDSSDAMELYTRAEVALDVARASGQRRVLLYSETCGDIGGQRRGSTDLRLHRVGDGRRDKPE